MRLHQCSANYALAGLGAFGANPLLEDDCRRRGGTWVDDGDVLSPGAPGVAIPGPTLAPDDASSWYDVSQAQAQAPVQAGVGGGNWLLWLLAGGAALALFGGRD